MREWRLSVRDRLINSPPDRVTGGVVVAIGQHPVAKARQRHRAFRQAQSGAGYAADRAAIQRQGSG
jgi:hypothetical protein